MVSDNCNVRRVSVMERRTSGDREVRDEDGGLVVVSDDHNAVCAKWREVGR